MTPEVKAGGGRGIVHGPRGSRGGEGYSNTLMRGVTGLRGHTGVINLIFISLVGTQAYMAPELEEGRGG